MRSLWWATWGGADTTDLTSGLDRLVGDGLADPKRLAVLGVSYGGFMSAWLVTQDPRFAAAVAISPVTNYVTEHLLSNVPHWPALFLGDSYRDTSGKYYTRSPVLYASKARTPTLTICGALDRCTPPEEGRQWHQALRGEGVSSVLVEYPFEGHGIRKMPAIIDCAARIVEWIDVHLQKS